MTDNHGVVTTAMTFYADGSYSDENVDGNGTLTCHFSYNGEGYVPAFNADGYFPADNSDVDGKLTWQLKNNEGVTTEVNGMLTWLLDGDGELTAEMKNLLTCHSEFNCEGRVVTDEVNGMLTCESEFNGEVVTDEMLTWQKNEEDEDELAKTSSAYVTINGNEELCGSSFSDSDTSYMAGISGAWIGLADETHGDMELQWGECEDEMLASFLGERECRPRAGF
nr:hypothetical protein [Tanacetum cinerariifolium]